MTYFILDKNTRELIRQSPTPFNVDESVQPPDPLIQLKRVDDDTKPPFDPATEKLVRIFTDNDIAFTRTFSWSVVAMTQDEIDEYEQAQQDEITRQQIRQFYLDLKNGVGTTAERAARLEKAVAWLLRSVARSEELL